jgi:hypothetical protein
VSFFNRKKQQAADAAHDGRHEVVVAPAGDDWVVQLTGNFPTAGPAILVGRAIASLLDLELSIRGEDGRIRQKDSHGHDSPAPG